jgi:CPA2 family monovalent cation:H+ antiporter-2
MGHLPDLIRDLALILTAGAVITIIFRKIRQPLVLGYIIAGFLVGPHIQFIPTVADHENIEVLAEIGVIFLLFGLGLEFSFKKLMRVGGAASITAFFEIAFITVAGFYAGKWMGWSTMDSMFLGGMLASSSTTIIIRAFDELGIKTKQFARIVFGVLIVEDIVVIILMVLLSSIAVTQQIEGVEILYTILKLLFFLSLWFIGGIFLLPSLLRRAKPLLNDETLLILSIGFCLGMVVLATQVGFSAELGAFMMGSIIAETTSAEKVEHLIKPIKDMFGAVFFVSVGMMIDPEAIVKYIWPIIIVTFLTLFGKLISTTIGALISGQPLKQSVQVGMSMAQIGEFAFIVATLGLSLGVISDFIFPVAVGASAITTFTTPYLINMSDPLSRFLERKLPSKWVRWLNRYSIGTQNIQAESDWNKVVRSYLFIIIVNIILVLGIMILSLNVLLPLLLEKILDPLLAKLTGLALSLAFASPFLWALMAKRPNNIAYKELWLNNRYNKGPLLVLEVLRIIIGTGLISFWVFRIFDAQLAIFIAVPVIIVILLIFGKKIQRFYQVIENRFIGNFNARETEEFNSLSANVSRRKAYIDSALSPWDAHIIQLIVPQQAEYIGRTLMELQWREKFGVNVVYIKRGDYMIHTPGRENILLPFDEVGILATDEQIKIFKPMFDTILENVDNGVRVDNIVLRKFVVDEHTKLKGNTIRESGIRERANGLVIGIERNNQRILNPESTTVFEWNDIVWIVGERKKIETFITNRLY